MIRLGKPKIDSLRLIVPLKDVTLNNKNPDFYRDLTTTNSDGEIVDEFVKTTSFNPLALVSTSYAIRHDIFLKADALYIGFSSKMLKEKYFDGISPANIDTIIDFVNSEGVVSISKEVFMSGRVVDVDFCADYFIEENVGNISSLIQVCIDLTIPQKRVNMYPYQKADNKGIQWGRREDVGRSYKRKQFLKYYAKAVELKNHSTAFYDAYLKDLLKGNVHFQDDRLLRVETTIKNSDHFKTYGYTVKTLNSLFDIKNDEQFIQIFMRPMSQYMTGYREIKHQEGLTMQQKIKTMLLFDRAKLLSMQVEDVISSLAMELYPESKEGRSRQKKEFQYLVEVSENIHKTHLHNTTDYRKFINEIEGKKLIP